MSTKSRAAEQIEAALVSAMTPQDRRRARKAATPAEPGTRYVAPTPNKIRRSLYACEHGNWTTIDEKFLYCQNCGVFRSFFKQKPAATMLALPAILKGRTMPPCAPGVHRFVLDKRVLLQRASYEDRWRLETFHLLVRFPRGWACSASFSEMRYHKVAAALAKVVRTKDPLRIWRRVQLAIYGTYFLSTLITLMSREEFAELEQQDRTWSQERKAKGASK